ncbi:MAG: HlyC/CorC family transporter [Bryobacterales bacterium]|nr:HlyC/CorC family transporter [Bryobacterales bacterium]
MFPDWLFIALLIAINSFYVAAEFGAVSVRRSKIRQLADNGGALAIRLLPIVTDPVRLDRYVAACQIGITWSSLVVGAYSQAFLAPAATPVIQAWSGWSPAAAQSAAIGVTLVVMTTFQVVLGELIPKSLALQYPTRVALYTLPLMQISLVVYAWFLHVLNGSGLAILRLLGFSQVGHAHIHSPEEIELLIAESHKGGLLEPEEHGRLRRAVRLVARPVRQLMVPRSHVVSIDVHSTPETLASTLRSVRYTRLPVKENSPDNIVGLLHSKDVVAFYLEHNRLPWPAEVMKPLVTIPGGVKADRLLSLFQERRTHQAAVVDEFSVVGLVTLGDFINELLGTDTDSVRGAQPPVLLPDGRVRLSGLMRVDETTRWTGVHLESEADTLGGHITYALGRIPEAGETVSIGLMEVQVESVAGNRVVSVTVRPVPSAAEKPDG